MAESTRKSKSKQLAALALAAAGAAAAGYYFYASEGAKDHRRKVARWAKDMKADVIRQAKKVRDMDRSRIVAIVDDVASAYKSMRNVDRKELSRAATELKKHWQRLVQEAQKSPAKKARKKTSKKRARTS